MRLNFPAGHDYYFPASQRVVSLTFLRRVAGRVPGQGGEHLPFVLPAQPGPQEQDRIQRPARHDVCRYGFSKLQLGRASLILEQSPFKNDPILVCREFRPKITLNPQSNFLFTIQKM